MQKKEFSEELKGPRITLKKHELSFTHATRMFEIINRNREDFAPWLDFVYKTKRPEDTYEWLVKEDRSWHAMEEADYAIYLADKYIGNISMMDISYTHNSGEIGYWLDKEYQNKGYVSEAVEVLEAEFFARGMHRIVIRCDEKNLASAGAAKKAGYRFESRAEEHCFNQATNGYRNSLTFVKINKKS